MNSESINTTRQDEAAIATALKGVFRAWAVVGRTACPPLELLHGYATGSLPAAQREPLERHFLHCDECLETAAVPVTGTVEERPRTAEAIPPGAADLVVRCHSGLFEILSNTLALRWLSEPVPVRGHVVPCGAHFQCYKVTGSVVTLLELSPSKTGAANLQVRLQEVELDVQSPIEVRLFANGREFASSSIARDPILFEDLIPAKWVVRICQGGEVLGETHIELQE
jgi:hypothetical protein